jgi:Mg-chelatase subunit ChlD
MNTRHIRRFARNIVLSGLALGFVACGGSAHREASAPADAASKATDMAGADEMAEPGYAPAAGYPAPAPAPEPPGAAPMAKSVDRAAAGGAPAEEREAPVRAESKPKKSTAYRKPSGGVKAGEWNDNANYREYLRYLKGAQLTPSFKLDVSKRRFIVVRDKDGKGVPNCDVRITDSKQRRQPLTLTTTASGRTIFFPKAEGYSGSLVASTTCLGSSRASAKFDSQDADGVVQLKLDKQRALPQQRTIDISFVLDTTGSMSEEIDAVKGTIRKVSAMLSKLNVNVRIGLVEYRDVSDKFVTRVYPMTSNISDFARKVDKLRANGGGDTPEHMNEGLRVAVSKMNWSKQSVARMMFVISDAPPHLDYAQDVEYTTTMQQANHGGIQIFTIAASGMDATGQTVLRQIAQYTGGTNMFVLRGGAGPRSTGGGDPTSSCGGTHKNYSSGNLSGLISDKINITLKSLDANPMLIAGLHKDELAKPCSERMVLAH